MILLNVISTFLVLFIDVVLSEFEGPYYYVEDAERTDTWNYYIAETTPMMKSATESSSFRAPTNPLKTKREPNPEDIVLKLLGRKKKAITSRNAKKNKITVERSLNPMTTASRTINYAEAAVRKLIGGRILEETTVVVPLESTAVLTTSLVPWTAASYETLIRFLGQKPTRTEPMLSENKILPELNIDNDELEKFVEQNLLRETEGTNLNQYDDDQKGDQNQINNDQTGNQNQMNIFQTLHQNKLDSIQTEGQNKINIIETGDQQPINKVQTVSHKNINNGQTENQNKIYNIQTGDQHQILNVQSVDRHPIINVQTVDQYIIDNIKTENQNQISDIQMKDQDQSNKDKTSYRLQSNYVQTGNRKQNKNHKILYLRQSNNLRKGDDGADADNNTTKVPTTACEAETIPEGNKEDMVFGPFGLFGKYGPNKHLFGDGMPYGKGGEFEPSAANNFSIGSFSGQEFIGPDGRRHELLFPAICLSTRCNDTFLKQLYTKHFFTGSTDPCGRTMLGRKGRTTTVSGSTTILTTKQAPQKLCVHERDANLIVPCRSPEELKKLSKKLGYNVTDVTVCVRNLTMDSKKYKYGQRFNATFVRCWTTTVKQVIELDVASLLDIIANLTYDYDMNLTSRLNETILGAWSVPPTCGRTAQTRPTYYELDTNETVVSKCFFCGMQEEGIPYSADCADAFAQDFIPLIPVNAQARGQLSRYRKYCRKKNIQRWYISPAEPRSVYGQWTGGCSVRWIDLSGVYTQRTCRNKNRAAMGMHFVSKRMAKLEMALTMVDNGCISSPMAVLVPFSRGISLYARFHACVCTGNFCNKACEKRQLTLINLIIFILIGKVVF